jgi:AcrR family transcriptional regulator
MSGRRDELIARSLDYFLRHGIAELSLRPLARQIGTSARLIIYHFGSRDGLITAVMDEVRTRLQKAFAEIVMETQKSSTAGIMRAFWNWMIDESHIGYVRLLFEVQVLAIQNPLKYARYLGQTSSSWLDIIESSLPPSKENRVIATMCAALIDGLLLEYLSTGDSKRTTKALEFFTCMMTTKQGRHRVRDASIE